MSSRRVVLVAFPMGSSEYAYFTNDITLKPGDPVVVEARNFFGCATVTRTRGVSEADKKQARAWVIDKINIKKTRKT